MDTILSLSKQLADGATSSQALTERALGRIGEADGQGDRAFIRVFREGAMLAARHADEMRAAGIVPSPLAGLPFSIKDLCDVRGITTLAGSIVRKEAEPAARDATVVARLRAAGAVIVGTTNMTEFAMGTPGTNAHYGTPLCPWDRETGRIPGGSSAGCAVSIADGMAVAGLGTDTAGSVRVPAALCGLAGFKPTARRIPLEGIFPLAFSLDSVGPLGASAACCAIVDAIFAGEPPEAPAPRPLGGLRLGALTTSVLDDMDDAVAEAYTAALSRLSQAGAVIEDIALAEIGELPTLNATGGFSTVEAYALHRDTLAARQADYDPHVAARILVGRDVAAHDYVHLMQARKRLIAAADAALASLDAVLMPTSPIVAAPLADLEDGAEWARVARLLLRNNIVGNFLDRCALSLPCHEPGTAPVGLMLMGRAMQDRDLLAIGQAVETALAA